MEFKRLGEVTLVEEAVDTANVLIEENGEIKRVPKTEVGGMGYPTAIIKHVEYDEYVNYMLTGGPQESDASVSEYECVNMTFEEAYEILSNGDFLHAVLMSIDHNYPVANVPLLVGFGGISEGEPAIILSGMYHETSIGSTYSNQFIWTADGIFTKQPGGSNPE